MWVASHLNPVALPSLQSKSHELLFVKATIDGKLFHVCVAYRPPSADSSVCTSLNTAFTKILSKNNSNLILVGDLNPHNFDWLGSRDGIQGLPKTEPFGSALENLCEDHGLSQMVDFPTHEVDKKLMYSCLDVVITNVPSKTTNVRALHPLGASHHVIVAFDINAKLVKPPPRPKITAPNFSKISEHDWVIINDYLNTCSFTVDKNAHSTKADYLNALVSVFTQHVHTAIELFVPKTTKGGARKKEWFDAACYNATKATNVAYRRWQASKSSVDHSNYLLSLAARNLAIKHAKKEYHTRLSMKVINAESSTRNWWSCLVNDVLDNNYKPSIPALEKDGQCYVTDQEKATLLNDCFVQHTHLDIPVNHIDDISSSESITEWETLDTVRVKQSDVLALMLGLKIGKATGSDAIPALFLKNTANSLYVPLTHIFHLSLKLGIFPEKWKIADVVALYKKKTKSDPGNYRPISLLPILSKLLETVVSNRFKKHIAPLLSMRQFGFRAGHTTLDLLLNMTQNWMN